MLDGGDVPALTEVSLLQGGGWTETHGHLLQLSLCLVGLAGAADDAHGLGAPGAVEGVTTVAVEGTLSVEAEVVVVWERGPRVVDIFAPLPVISAPTRPCPPDRSDHLAEVSLVLTGRVRGLLSRHLPPTPLHDEDEEDDEDQEEEDDGENDAGNDSGGVRPAVLKYNPVRPPHSLRAEPSLTRINGSGLGLTLMMTEIVST